MSNENVRDKRTTDNRSVIVDSLTSKPFSRPPDRRQFMEMPEDIARHSGGASGNISYYQLYKHQKEKEFNEKYKGRILGEK